MIIKRFLSILISVPILLSGLPVCSLAETTDKTASFKSMSDPVFLQYLEDSVFAEAELQLGRDDYQVENVSAIYISKEYLDELAFNSQANIFFGFTLAEVEEQIQGTKYLFTLGDNGETIVKPFTEYEDETFKTILRNTAVGGGVILLCTTVAVTTAAVGAPASVTFVFAVAAKSAISMSVKGAIFGGLSAGIVKGLQTGNFDEALKTGAIAASEGFKWGAIGGAITGGLSEYTVVRGDIRTWRDSELSLLDAYGGTEQVSYLDGELVPKNTFGASRPDIIRNVNGHLEAIEVKNYDLQNTSSYYNLKQVLHREIEQRITNLPPDTTQRIALDVKGRGYSQIFLEEVQEDLSSYMFDIYPDIPIDIFL